MHMPFGKKSEVLRSSIKAFMDDITVLTREIEDAKRVLKSIYERYYCSHKRNRGCKEGVKKLDKLISLARIKFKSKKSRNCRTVTGKAKQIHFSIAGDRIPTAKEQLPKR